MKATFKRLFVLLIAIVLLISPLSVKQLISAAGEISSVPEFNAALHTDITNKFIVEKSGSSVSYLQPSNWADGYTVNNTSQVMPNERIAFSNIYTSIDGTVYFSAKVKSGLVSGGSNADWAGPAIYLGKATHDTKGEGYITALMTKSYGMDIRFKNAFNADIYTVGQRGNYPDSNSYVRGNIDYTITAAVTKESMTVFVNDVKWIDNFRFADNGFTYENFEFAIGFVCCSGSVSNIRAWCANEDFREPDRTPVYNADDFTDLNPLLQIGTVGAVTTAEKAEGLFRTSANGSGYVDFGNITGLVDDKIIYTANFKKGVTSNNADENAGPVMYIGKAQYGSKVGSLALVLTENNGMRLALLDTDNSVIVNLTELEYGTNKGKERNNIDYSVTAVIGYKNFSLYVNTYTMLSEHSVNGLGITLLGHELKLGFINAGGQIEKIRAFCPIDEYVEIINISNKADVIKTEILGGASSETPLDSAGSYSADSDSDSKSVFINVNATDLLTDDATVLTKTVFATRTDYPTENGLQVVRLGKVNHNGTEYFADLHLTKADGMKVVLVQLDNTVTSTVLSTADYIKADGTATKIRFDLKDDQTILTAANDTEISIYISGYKVLNILFNNDFSFVSANVGAGIRNMKTHTTGFIKRYNTGVKEFSVYCFKADKYSTAPVYNKDTDTNLNSNTEAETIGSNISVTDQVNNGGYFIAESTVNNVTGDKVNLFDYNIKADGTLYLSAVIKGGLSSGTTDEAFAGPLFELADVEKDGQEGKLAIRFTTSKYIELFIDGENIVDLGVKCDYPDTLSANRGKKAYDVTVEINGEYISLWVNGEQIITRYTFADNGITFKDLYSAVEFAYCKGIVKDIFLWCKNEDATAIEGVPTFNPQTDYDLTKDMVTYSQSGVEVTGDANSGYSYNCSAEGKNIKFTRFYVKPNGGYITSFVLRAESESSITWGGQELVLANVDIEGVEGSFALRFIKSGGVRAHIYGSGIDTWSETGKYPDTKTANRNDSIDYNVTVSYLNNKLTVWMNGKKVLRDIEVEGDWGGKQVKVTETILKFMMTRTKGTVSNIKAWTPKENYKVPDGAPKFNSQTDYDLTKDMVTYSQAGVEVTGNANDGYSYNCSAEGKNIKFSKFYVKPNGGYITNFVIRAGGNSSVTWGGQELVLANVKIDGADGYFALRFMKSGGIRAHVTGGGIDIWSETKTYPETETANRNDMINYNVTVSYLENKLNVWINDVKVINDLTVEGEWDGKQVVVTETLFKFMMTRTTGSITNIKAWTPKENYKVPDGAPKFNSQTDYDLTKDMVTYSQAGVEVTGNANDGYSYNCSAEGKNIKFSKFYVKPNGGYITNFVIRAGGNSSVTWGGQELVLANVKIDGADGYFALRFMKSGGIRAHVTGGGIDIWSETKTYPETETANRNDMINYNVTVSYLENKLNVWINDVKVINDLTVEGEWDGKQVVVTETLFKFMMTRTTGSITNIKAWTPKENMKIPDGAPEFNPSLHTNLTANIKPSLAAGVNPTYNSNGTYNIAFNQVHKNLSFSNLQIDYRGTLYTKAVIKAGTTGEEGWTGPDILVSTFSNNETEGYFGIRFMKTGGIYTYTTNLGSHQKNGKYYNYPESDSYIRNDNIDYEVVIASNINEVSVWVNDVLIVDKYKLDFPDATITGNHAGIYNTKCTVNFEDYQVWCEKKDVVKSTANTPVTQSIYAASGVPAKPEGNVNYADYLKSADFETAKARYGFYWNEETNTFWSTKSDTFSRMEIGNFTDMTVSDTFAMKFKYTVKDFQTNGTDQGSMGLRLYFRGFKGHSSNQFNARGIMFCKFGANEYEMWNYKVQSGAGLVDYGFEVGRTYDVEILSGPSELGLWIDGTKIFYYHGLADCEPYFTFEVYRAIVEMADVEIYNINPETYKETVSEMTPILTDLSKNDSYSFDATVNNEKSFLAVKNVIVVSWAVIFVAFVIFTIFLFKGKNKKGGKTV